MKKFEVGDRVSTKYGSGEIWAVDDMGYWVRHDHWQRELHAMQEGPRQCEDGHGWWFPHDDVRQSADPDLTSRIEAIEKRLDAMCHKPNAPEYSFGDRVEVLYDGEWTKAVIGEPLLRDGEWFCLVLDEDSHGGSVIVDVKPKNMRPGWPSK